MNKGRTDLDEIICACGCKEKFKPMSEKAIYKNAKHRKEAWKNKHPDKQYKSKRVDLMMCINSLLCYIDKQPNYTDKSILRNATELIKDLDVRGGQSGQTIHDNSIS